MNVMSPPTQALPAPQDDADVALSGVCEIAEVLAEPQPLERALGAALDLLHRFCALDRGLVCLVDDTGAPRPLAARRGDAAEAAERAGAAFLAEIATAGLPSVVRTPGCTGGEKEVRIGVPLKEAGRVVGTLSVERLRRAGMAGHCDDDLRVLSIVASLMAAALRARPVAEEPPPLKPPPAARPRDLGIVGSSAALGEALEKVSRVAGTALAVLLRGESGTGKELFAHAVHRLSRREGGPFVKVNCAALPETMLESELFGHEKGAFTGALAMRKGRFELADGGTLFLDEIGDISPAFQAKLLRVLQEGEFERVGGTRTLKVDVRIVAATNRDLEAAVAAGDFRSDLYYRLGVVPIRLPALRDRPADIPVLARHVLQRFNAENRARLRLGASALEVVRACAFPGNVRELENCIRRTAVLAQSPLIEAADFACRGDGCSAALLARHLRAATRGRRPPEPREMRGENSHGAGLGAPRDADTAFEAGHPPPQLPQADAAQHAARDEASGGRTAQRARARIYTPRLPDAEALIEALETAGWVQAKAARLLNLTPRQVAYALNRHGIDVKKF
ncbi:nif-specific transcriptional activator NifA [Xanthobacter sp. V2C-8]|uniref:nif-specific transcriptional activator NifA n=1 Tax=Xanthobacter albus TaxID=3119929 RepID=UPI003729A670